MQQVIPYHHHIYLAAMFCFIIGQLLHALAKVNEVATANKQPFDKVFYDRWITLFVRFGICMFLFLGLLEGQIGDVITATHLTLPQWAQALLQINVSNGAIAGLAGFAFDSALTYIPGIQKLGVPPAIDAQNGSAGQTPNSTTKVDAAPPKG